MGDMQGINELLGPWSTIAFGVGLSGWLATNKATATRLFGLSEPKRTYVRRHLPWVLLLFALALSEVVLPMHNAYSGPIPYEARVLTEFDIYFAFCIAYAFGFGSALAALRIPDSRARILSRFCLALYLAIAICMLGLWWFART